MLEIKFVRKNLSAVQAAMKARGHDAELDSLKKSDDERRDLLQDIESLRHQRNVVSERIAEMRKAGEDTETLVVEMRTVSNKIKKLDKKLTRNQQTIDNFLLGLPNVAHSSVPVGADETDNPIIRKMGELPQFKEDPQPHWEVGSRLKILDLERASKIAGARFPLYFGAGARLERALINFMLDTHIQEHAYQEVLPPFIVNRQSMTHTGQLPKFEEDLFKLADWDYFLIPTAEVPVTNIHQGEILDEDLLPIYYVAYTPCFRSEAGSYGKDTRGLIRQHQFNKVELVKLTKPETSYEELESLLKNAESILQKLEIPYQIIELCTGDLGFSAAKTFDIEVWMPAQKVYREISSCSNFEDFQARRANLRFKRKGQKGTQFVHTLNGSGLAVGRTVAAILENFQQADGSVIIPELLKPYMGGMEKIAL